MLKSYETFGFMLDTECNVIFRTQFTFVDNTVPYFAVQVIHFADNIASTFIQAQK